MPPRLLHQPPRRQNTIPRPVPFTPVIKQLSSLDQTLFNRYFPSNDSPKETSHLERHDLRIRIGRNMPTTKLHARRRLVLRRPPTHLFRLPLPLELKVPMA